MVQNQCGTSYQIGNAGFQTGLAGQLVNSGQIMYQHQRTKVIVNVSLGPRPIPDPGLSLDGIYSERSEVPTRESRLN